MEKEILILFSSALCDLNCNYCYINKTPTLQEIDKTLEQSFNDKNYYINYINEVFDNKETLKELQLWGAEPTLGINRIIPILDYLILQYPNFYKIMFSTNFISKDWFNKVALIFNLLKKYPNKNFEINIQLSIDGPQNINDYNRGINATKRFLNNLNILIQKIKEQWIPNNAHLNINFKQTLSLESIKNLQTKKEIIDYFKFFDKLNEILLYYSAVIDNFNFNVSIPNIAEPCPATTQDGKNFAIFVKQCREIEKEKIFKTYKYITPFSQEESHCKKCIKFNFGCQNCGQGITTIGLLPNKKIALCLDGFYDLIENNSLVIRENNQIDNKIFINREKQKMICDYSELLKFQKMSKNVFFKEKSTFLITNITAQIILLAKYNFIDSKYQSFKEANFIAQKYVQRMIFCMRNNLTTTGSIFLCHTGMLKLLLNGAMEYILKEEDYENK